LDSLVVRILRVPPLMSMFPGVKELVRSLAGRLLTP